METKVCKKCGKELTLDKFGKYSKAKDGLNSKCKDCKNVEGALYRKNHPDRIKASQDKFKKNNPEKIREGHALYRKKYPKKNKACQKAYREKSRAKLKTSSVKYHLDHKDIETENNRIYRENNREVLQKRSAKFYKDNPNKMKTYVQKRNAKKRLLPSSFTFKQWEEVKLYFGQKCCYCGKELPLTQEHFIAINKGGGYIKENMIPACGHCNSSKSDKLFEEWYPDYEFYSKEREEKILDYLIGMDNNKLKASGE